MRSNLFYTTVHVVQRYFMYVAFVLKHLSICPSFFLLIFKLFPWNFMHSCVLTQGQTLLKIFRIRLFFRSVLIPCLSLKSFYMNKIRKMWDVLGHLSSKGTPDQSAYRCLCFNHIRFCGENCSRITFAIYSPILTNITSLILHSECFLMTDWLFLRNIDIAIKSKQL